MYDDILLPVDGSEGSARVRDHVADIAHWADASVTVLYVADSTRDSVTVVEGKTVDALESKGEDVVAEATNALAGQGVDAEGDVVQGNPAPTIADYADEYGHDLVVMATHGRAGLSRFLRGSVTEKVVRLASMPVLTARLAADETLQFPYETLLLPTDGSETAERAARHGLDVAAALDATAHLLSVVDDGALGPDVRSTVAAAESEEAAETAVGVLADEAAERGVETVEHVAHGDPGEEIRAHVESAGTDAVVMGTTGRSGVEKILLGSVAEAALRTVRVPVVTLGEGA
ncbi:MAG: universal stress protein [Halobacteriaceae archaeon]